MTEPRSKVHDSFPTDELDELPVESLQILEAQHAEYIHRLENSRYIPKDELDEIYMQFAMLAIQIKYHPGNNHPKNPSV